MTGHDRVRMERAEDYLRDKKDGLLQDAELRRQRLIDAVGGLQSTDDPSLVPLWEELSAELHELQQPPTSAAPRSPPP